jgi:hypothetical protein
MDPIMDPIHRFMTSDHDTFHATLRDMFRDLCSHGESVWSEAWQQHSRFPKIGPFGSVSVPSETASLERACVSFARQVLTNRYVDACMQNFGGKIIASALGSEEDMKVIRLFILGCITKDRLKAVHRVGTALGLKAGKGWQRLSCRWSSPYACFLLVPLLYHGMNGILTKWLDDARATVYADILGDEDPDGSESDSDGSDGPGLVHSCAYPRDIPMPEVLLDHLRECSIWRLSNSAMNACEAFMDSKVGPLYDELTDGQVPLWKVWRGCQIRSPAMVTYITTGYHLHWTPWYEVHSSSLCDGDRTDPAYTYVPPMTMKESKVVCGMVIDLGLYNIKTHTFARGPSTFKGDIEAPACFYGVPGNDTPMAAPLGRSDDETPVYLISHLYVSTSKRPVSVLEHVAGWMDFPRTFQHLLSLPILPNRHVLKIHPNDLFVLCNGASLEHPPSIPRYRTAAIAKVLLGLPVGHVFGPFELVLRSCIDLKDVSSVSPPDPGVYADTNKEQLYIVLHTPLPFRLIGISRYGTFYRGDYDDMVHGQSEGCLYRLAFLSGGDPMDPPVRPRMDWAMNKHNSKRPRASEK